MSSQVDRETSSPPEAAAEPATEGQGGGAEDKDKSALIDTMVGEWRAELDGQTSIPATSVQDRLLDLWGALPESPTRAEVERWLTETLARHLYQADDVSARLESVLSTSDN